MFKFNLMYYTNADMLFRNYCDLSEQYRKACLCLLKMDDKERLDIMTFILHTIDEDYMLEFFIKYPEIKPLWKNVHDESKKSINHKLPKDLKKLFSIGYLSLLIKTDLLNSFKEKIRNLDKLKENARLQRNELWAQEKKKRLEEAANLYKEDHSNKNIVNKTTKNVDVADSLKQTKLNFVKEN